MKCAWMVAAALLFSVAPAAAEEGTSARSCGVVARANVVACVLETSPAVRAEREAIAGAVGRRTAVRPWFPSPPILSLSAGHRTATGTGEQAVNYYASLAQDVAIGGERSSRRRAAEADIDARTNDTVAVSRRVAADAYAAYFDVLAARDAVAVARLLESTALSIARVTRARAEAGVGSSLDADVADAASLRIVQSRIGAERTESAAGARLASMLGRDPLRDAPRATGELEPLAGSDALAQSASPRGVADRPEVKALRADERAATLRAEAFRRARVPTLTLQLFAQNDGFNERVLGGGVSLPVPLPEPIGHRFTGAIAELEALSRETGARAELTTRELSNDLARAVVEFRSRRDELALYSREKVARAEQLLGEIGKEIEIGRLPARDALVAQQQLIEVLRGYVEARRALCLASVDLALAAGVALEGAPR